MANYDHYIVPIGHELNGRTLAMWNEAEFIVGDVIPITQGSYNKGGVKASAGAHDGGGAVDCRPGFRDVSALDIVKALRRVGFAAWERFPNEGKWPHHIHAIALGDKELSPVAAAQAKAYLDGYNGLGHLGHGGKDKGPRTVVQTWEQYKAKHPGRYPKKKVVKK